MFQAQVVATKSVDEVAEIIKAAAKKKAAAVEPARADKKAKKGKKKKKKKWVGKKALAEVPVAAEDSSLKFYDERQ